MKLLIDVVVILMLILEDQSIIHNSKSVRALFMRNIKFQIFIIFIFYIKNISNLFYMYVYICHLFKNIIIDNCMVVIKDFEVYMHIYS